MKKIELTKEERREAYVYLKKNYEDGNILCGLCVALSNYLYFKKRIKIKIIRFIS